MELTDLYEHLRRGGAATLNHPARYAVAEGAEAHTIRLALLYALLDGERYIQQDHLTAALALWDYALPLRHLRARPGDRRPARRTDPSRARPLPPRADPHPALRP